MPRMSNTSNNLPQHATSVDLAVLRLARLIAQQAVREDVPGYPQNEEATNHVQKPQDNG
jgi:hypothetical protein